MVQTTVRGNKSCVVTNFMGVRAGLWNMDVTKITVGLALTSGSTTHPENVKSIVH